MDEEDLNGEDGILSNKTEKGKVWEVPAKLKISGMRARYYQTVGLRFHGGEPGRKKNIESFRIYARKEYGKSYLDTEPILGRKRSKEIKTLVLKYTYQAYRPQMGKNFNPFNYALALDVADAIGALVPSHNLVELFINNRSLGMYIAMEHLSDRSIRNWLDSTDFLTFHYKKINPEYNGNSLSVIVHQIRSKYGEDAFAEFARRYNVENVINSIILTSYIADDDYCQGVDILDNIHDPAQTRITSINYDLDHAFIQYYRMKELRITANRKAFPHIKKGCSQPCFRSCVYAWVYSESATFRKLLRERLEYLLKNELSPESVNSMLDEYRRINAGYFQGAYEKPIAQLAKYARERPQILLNQLKKLENRTQLEKEN